MSDSRDPLEEGVLAYVYWQGVCHRPPSLADILAHFLAIEWRVQCDPGVIIEHAIQRLDDRRLLVSDGVGYRVTPQALIPSVTCEPGILADVPRLGGAS